MNKNYYAVIMAGGIGSRFWPVSTSEFPKQFHDMLGTGETLLQKTFSRLNKIIPSENIFILTNERYLQITLSQLPEISEDQVLLEPAMRNTAPCILLSALKIQKQNPDAVMLVAPSDHWIEDEIAYSKDVEACFIAAQKDDILMTLGIEPTFPNTGYGYIEADKSGESNIKKVNQFREKPDYNTAKDFLASGNFLWNAGIFIWSVASITKSFKQFLPQMNSENISIDYGILEKAENVFVKKANFDWNDLGTWGALYDKLEKDVHNNSIVNAETHLVDSENNMIFTATKKLVVLDGIEDYIVVDKEDVLLVYPKKKEQEIKGLLQEVSNKFDKKYV